MNELLKLVLSLSLSGGLLIVAVLLCRHFLKGRISKTWQYYIWLVVIARLLLPVPTELDLVSETALQSDRLVFVHTLPAVEPASEPIIAPADAAEAENLAGPGPGEAPADAGGTIWEFWSLPEKLWVLWLGVAFFLFLRKVVVYRSFGRQLRAGGERITDPALLERLNRAKAEAGVNGSVELYGNPMAVSPMLLGFFRPYIVLPGTDLPERDIHYILLHELSHCKRGDMFYKWLVQFTCCLHWFNPLVWLMAREINRDCELACDEAVIRTLDEPARRAYGDTLLHAMEAGLYQKSVGAVTLSESARRLKERLGAIMDFKKKRVTVPLLVTLVLVCVAVVVGACVRTEDSSLKYQQIYEQDGGYVIVCEDAEGEMPVLTKTEGTIKLALVESGRTIVLDVPGDIWTLSMEAENLGKDMVRAGEMTRREMHLVVQAAEKICEEYGPGYATYQTVEIGYPPVGRYETPDGTHEGPYIFGYSCNKKGFEGPADLNYIFWDAQAQESVTLAIYFNDKKLMNDPRAMKVLQDHMEMEYRSNKDRDILRTNFRVDWLDYIGDVGAEALAEKYYKEGERAEWDLWDRGDEFCQILGLLDEGTRREWLERMYQEEDVWGFVYAFDSLGGGGEDDGEMVETFARRAYNDNKELIFNALVKLYMDQEELEQWKEQLEQDGREEFLSTVTEVQESEQWKDEEGADWKEQS